MKNLSQTFEIKPIEIPNCIITHRTPTALHRCTMSMNSASVPDLESSLYEIGWYLCHQGYGGSDVPTGITRCSFGGDNYSNIRSHERIKMCLDWLPKVFFSIIVDLEIRIY